MAVEDYPQAFGGAATAGGPSSYATGARPHRPHVQLHWSNWIALGGGVAMFVALLAVAIDLPATAFYDEAAPGKRVLYEGHDPMRVSNAIDSNMKYIRTATGNGADQYNGLLASVDRSEEVMPLMGAGVSEMDGSVKAIDAGLSKVLASTKQMAADMAVMQATSASSATTMAQVDDDIAKLGATMRSLYGESEQLDAALRRIERKARGLAQERIAPAVKGARELNGVLPPDVPAPRTSLTPEPLG